ncbi:hypothetical protein INT82_13430 [Mannheimia haemolytica]|nr:hypothetical protein [Mannheimia haemolytica]
MLKKLSAIFLLLPSAVLANNLQNITASTEPKYKISEIDVRILIRQLNNIEQCIYPELAKPGYQQIYANWNLAENLTMQYFEYQLLKELLGEENQKLMQNDTLSTEYFHLLHSRLNHQKANVDPEKCDTFKPRYKEIYKSMENALTKKINSKKLAVFTASFFYLSL